MMQDKINRRSGFTLIELLVAMGILVMGVTSILGLLTFGAALQRTAERRTEVSLVAEQVIADLRATAFPIHEDGSIGDPSTHIEMNAIAGHPRVSAKVDLKRNPGMVGEYFATIQIEWRERGQTKAQEFRTILQREAPFGRRVEVEYRRTPPKK